MHRTLAFVTMAALPGGLAAQATGWSLHLEPRIGFFTPDKAMGLLAPMGPVVEMKSSASVGLAFHVQTPLRPIALRALAERTIGADLYARCLLSTPETPCRPDPDFSYPLAQGSSILNLAASVLLAPGRVHDVAPYIVGGIGLKRYDLGNGFYQEDPRYRFGGRTGAIAWHGGIGVEFPVGHTRLTLEAVNHLSGIHGPRYTPPSEEPYWRSLSQLAASTLKHDLFFTAGVRVPVFGGR